jgi:hypothetical protein
VAPQRDEPAAALPVPDRHLAAPALAPRMAHRQQLPGPRKGENPRGCAARGVCDRSPAPRGRRPRRSCPKPAGTRRGRRRATRRAHHCPADRPGRTAASARLAGSRAPSTSR